MFVCLCVCVCVLLFPSYILHLNPSLQDHMVTSLMVTGCFKVGSCSLHCRTTSLNAASLRAGTSLLTYFVGVGSFASVSDGVHVSECVCASVSVSGCVYICVCVFVQNYVYAFVHN